MTPPMGAAAGVAADSFLRISDGVVGERRARAASVALVLRVVAARAGGAPVGFMERRAAAEVARISSSAERASLDRLLTLARDGGGSAELAAVLNRYAADLERGRRLEEADAVIRLALTLAPARADLVLRAGRIARMLGDRDRAVDHYRRARDLDAGGSIARLAAVGEAVVSAEAERELGRVARAAVVAGDCEAAAVALEERARIRRAAGRRRAAARDLCIAAARFPDAVDRARVAHALADIATAAGDALAAREALLFALEAGDATQRSHATSRLHTVARDMRDEVGARRWRSFSPPAMVSLSLRRKVSPAESIAGDLARWREMVVSRRS